MDMNIRFRRLNIRSIKDIYYCKIGIPQFVKVVFKIHLLMSLLSLEVKTTIYI